MNRVCIIVHGKVQGVFFRANTKKAALSLGLTGYARNKEDGSVEVVAEGPEDRLNEIIEYCKKGPERAKVTKVDVKLEKASGEFKNFEVKH